MQKYIKLLEFVGVVSVIVMLSGCNKEPEQESVEVPEVGTVENLGRKVDANIDAASDAVDSAVDATTEALNQVADKAKEVVDNTKIVADIATDQAKDAINKGADAMANFANEIKPKIDEASKVLEKVATDSGKTIEQLKIDLNNAMKAKAPATPPPLPTK